MKNKTFMMKIACIVATVILVIAYIASVFQSKPQKATKEKTYTIKKADPYVFEGKVSAKRSFSINIDGSKGKLKDTLVSDGDLVRKHQTLVTYKNTSVTSQIPGQRKTVSQAYKTYHNAYAAYLKLANKKKKTPIEVESLKTLKENMESTRQTYKDAQEALNNLESHRINRVKSNIAGYVSINTKAKDDHSQTYITVTSNRIEVVGSVSEFDYTKLRQGASVTINVISTNQKVQGNITKINKVPTSQEVSENTSSDTSTYNFYVAPDDEIQYGYSVEISLPVNEIQVPKKYIKKGSNGYFAYLYKNGKKIKTDVNVKETSDYYIVQSGLDVNDKVVIE